MMIKFILVVVLALTCSQVQGDVIDDLIEQYKGQLNALAAVTDGHALEATTNLDETDLYMSHALQTFKTSASNEIIDQQASVNRTASDLTLTAITNNKPASVLTCINTQRETGITNLEALEPPFVTKVDGIYTSSSSAFTSQRSTIETVKSQLPTLLADNSGKMESCVVEACFQSNLQAAGKQYDNLNTILATIVTEVKNARSRYNDQMIDILNKLRTDAQSAVDAAVKKMGKC